MIWVNNVTLLDNVLNSNKLRKVTSVDVFMSGSQGKATASILMKVETDFQSGLFIENWPSTLYADTKFDFFPGYRGLERIQQGEVSGLSLSLLLFLSLSLCPSFY
jgi:hypothetical protein